MLRLPPNLSRSLNPTGWALAILAFMALLNGAAAQNHSATYDEPAHLRYGYQVLAGNAARFDDSKMPVTALNALSAALLGGPRPESDRILPNARMATLLIWILLGLWIHRWCQRLYGPAAAAAALFLFAVDPNLGAHARWVTTDLYAAFFIFVAVERFSRLLDRPGWLHAVQAGFALALAQAAKFSAVYLYIILFALWAAQSGLPALHSGKIRSHWRTGLLYAGVHLLVLNALFLFDGTGMPFAAHAWKSELFQQVSRSAGWLARLPLPFPAPFLEGLDWVKHYETEFSGRCPGYLLGQILEQKSFAYYPVVLWFKIPIPVQILCAFALLRALRKNSLPQGVFSLWLPTLFYLAYFVFFCRAQMGIRLLLPILPFVYVLLGQTVRELFVSGKKVFAWVGVALCVWAACSPLSYYPHTLSYFNEWAWNRKHLYRILADSDLDWGQNDGLADRYVASRPWICKNPTAPVEGMILVSANFLTGVVFPEKHDWMRVIRRAEPVGHVGYSYLLFFIHPGSLGRLNGGSADH